MANQRPVKRTVLKHKEDGTFVPLFAHWPRQDGTGTYVQLDGRVRGISIKWEDDDGNVRTTHVPRGSAEDPSPFWINEYRADAGKPAAKPAGKPAAKPA